MTYIHSAIIMSSDEDINKIKETLVEADYDNVVITKIDDHKYIVEKTSWDYSDGISEILSVIDDVETSEEVVICLGGVYD